MRDALVIARKLANLPLEQSAAVKAYFSAPRGEEEGDRYANELFMAACSTPEAQANFTRFSKTRQG